MSEEVTTAETTGTAEPRDINKLLELSYSEMTNKEIDILMGYKCNLAARDAAYEARQEAFAAHIESLKQANAEITNRAKEILENWKVPTYE